MARSWALGEWAERGGSERPIRLRVCRISSAVLSTTQPPLQRHQERIPRGRARIYPSLTGETRAESPRPDGHRNSARNFEKIPLFRRDRGGHAEPHDADALRDAEPLAFDVFVLVDGVLGQASQR